MSEIADIATVIIYVDNQGINRKHNEILVLLCFAQG